MLTLIKLESMLNNSFNLRIFRLAVRLIAVDNDHDYRMELMDLMKQINVYAANIAKTIPIAGW